MMLRMCLLLQASRGQQQNEGRKENDGVRFLFVCLSYTRRLLGSVGQTLVKYVS